MHHDRQERCNAIPHIAPIQDHIDGAVFNQKLAPLESFRERLAYRLFDHAWSRKPDEGVRFGNINISEHGETCRDPARSRISQDRNVWNPGMPQHTQRCAGLCHLHERDNRLLHPGSSACGEAHQCGVICDAMVDGAHEPFSDHGSHGTAHEIEFERAGNDRNRLYRARNDNERIGFSGFPLRLRQTILVFFCIPEFQPVHRFYVAADFLTRLRIQELIKPSTCADAHMMRAFRAYLQVTIKFRPIEYGIAVRALGPDPFRHSSPRCAVRLYPGRKQFLQPAHGVNARGRDLDQESNYVDRLLDQRRVSESGMQTDSKGAPAGQGEYSGKRPVPPPRAEALSCATRLRATALMVVSPAAPGPEA